MKIIQYPVVRHILCGTPLGFNGLKKCGGEKFYLYMWHRHPILFTIYCIFQHKICAFKSSLLTHSMQQSPREAYRFSA